MRRDLQPVIRTVGRVLVRVDDGEEVVFGIVTIRDWWYFPYVRVANTANSETAGVSHVVHNRVKAGRAQ